MRKVEIEALREHNLDLFDSMSPASIIETISASERIPTESELNELFDALNEQFFAGGLPKARVEWSSRMKHAGKCMSMQRIIRLGESYHRYYPEDVVDTLKHEMIHLMIPSHGADFKKEARRIGASFHAKNYPGMLRGMKYLYTCPGCGAMFPSMKRYRERSCGKCSKGRYDPRFKLKFVRRLDEKL